MLKESRFTTCVTLALLGVVAACGSQSADEVTSGRLNLHAVWPQAREPSQTERCGVPPDAQRVQVVFQASPETHATFSCCVKVDPCTVQQAAGDHLLVIDRLPLGPATVTLFAFPTANAPGPSGITATCSTIPVGRGESCDGQPASPTYESDPQPLVVAESQIDTPLIELFPVRPPSPTPTASSTAPATPTRTQTVTPSPTPIPAWTSHGPSQTTIDAFAVDPSDPGIVYAGGGILFKSTDGGETWTTMVTGLNATFVQALAIDSTVPPRLYAGTIDGGVFTSTDGAGSWRATNDGINTNNIRALRFDPAAPQTLYAGGAGGVFKSTDGGTDWMAIVAGLNDRDVLALGIDPNNPRTLYAGTSEGGVFKSINGGGNWTAMNTGLSTTFAQALVIDPTASQTVYVGTNGGVFKSTDGASSWTALNMGLSATAVQALVLDPRNPHVLYAGTQGGGVFKSIDGGENWTAMNMGLALTDVLALTLDPTTPATLYAGTNGGGVFSIPVP